MEKGICNVSIAPIRAENTDKSEMITQMLFGESADILDIKDNFTKVRLHYDQYEGWIDTKQITIISDADYNARQTTFVKEAFLNYATENGNNILSLGSEITTDSPQENPNTNVRESIIASAYQYLNVPYLWGGKSFFGIDCSGFTQMIYKINNLKIPRDAYQQANLGEPLTFLEEALPGDLAFFENNEGKITHVGIILENQKIIHAHGKVRIDSIDSSGIYNDDQKKHTHKLRVIKSFI